MKVVTASAEIIYPKLNSRSIDEMYKNIELAGRTCYKSENKITPESARKFIRGLIKSGHEAMIEHASMTVRFVADRGVTHEIVRHRIASYAQESTRYCNYSKDKFENSISVIKPFYFEGPENIDKLNEWITAMEDAEKHYFALIKMGATPQEARTVLPTGLKAEIIMTANMREWRTFFKLRAAGVTGAAHPQTKEVALSLLRQCQELMPELFDDIIVEE